MPSFNFTEKEVAALITALGFITEVATVNVGRISNSRNAMALELAKELRQFLSERNMSPTDFKEIAIKLGVSEKVVYEGMADLK